MIRFLTDKTVSLIRYGQGSIVNLSGELEAALIAEGAAESFPVISKPVEVLSSSAVAVPCASTGVEEVLASFVIPAGTLGVNSILQIEPLWTFASSGNNKILKVKVAGIPIYTTTRTTSAKECPLIVLANRNSLSSQIQPYDNNYGTAGSGAPSIYSVDFSVNQTMQITAQRTVTEALVLEYYRALHFVGD
ncbi:MAG: hypothetical protein H0U72_04375 [Nitrosospira sp.]|nr:hypothetical protein [Nitrosospira sp.]